MSKNNAASHQQNPIDSHKSTKLIFLFNFFFLAYFANAQIFRSSTPSMSFLYNEQSVNNGRKLTDDGTGENP